MTSALLMHRTEAGTSHGDDDGDEDANMWRQQGAHLPERGSVSVSLQPAGVKQKKKKKKGTRGTRAGRTGQVRVMFAPPLSRKTRPETYTGLRASMVRMVRGRRHSRKVQNLKEKEWKGGAGGDGRRSLRVESGRVKGVRPGGQMWMAVDAIQIRQRTHKPKKERKRKKKENAIRAGLASVM